MSSSPTLPRRVEPSSELSPPPLTGLLVQITDPRKPRGIRHQLHVLLAIGLAAVIAGAKTFTAIAEWAQDSSNTALPGLAASPSRRPSEATLRRALTLVDADVLDRALGAWTWTRTAVLAGRRVIAIDGKTVRSARAKGATAPHLVAAFDHATGTVLDQLQITAKSNEIPAVRDLLAHFDLTGALVTIDAMHTQRETA